MLTNEDIKQIIKECRSIADAGLGNGNRADIPELLVDVVQPPNDFLGVDGNPAIFINQHTFNLLGHLHSNWIVNQTIALKRELLNRRTIEILGVIIHETGHAFNVAAQIGNTEANSYIFEIEAILHLYNTQNPLMKNCSIPELLAYFDLRLKYYNKSSKGNDHLLSLIEQVHQFQAEHKAFLPIQKERSFRGFSFFQSHDHALIHEECGTFFIDEYELQPRNPACLPHIYENSGTP